MTNTRVHTGYTTKNFHFWKIVLGTMYSVQPILPTFTTEFNITVSYACMSLSMTTVGLMIGLLVFGFFFG
ncbi:hypothetical protein [Psychrobacillus antarcticus]|uniref:hypothetical protein n=1 Tax=Psychrobacillus antarcticus TaxID=2879115 RepID=UPI002407786A|nr:hypothetical protein [Psychrobacillus antarcticus]